MRISLNGMIELVGSCLEGDLKMVIQQRLPVCELPSSEPEKNLGAFNEQASQWSSTVLQYSWFVLQRQINVNEQGTPMQLARK